MNRTRSVTRLATAPAPAPGAHTTTDPEILVLGACIARLARVSEMLEARATGKHFSTTTLKEKAE